MVYTPQPIDVSDIELNKSLKDLIEKLAKNTHDIWATQRHTPPTDGPSEKSGTTPKSITPVW